MSQVELYLDEDAMDSDLVVGLRSQGIDTLTAHDAGTVQYLDEVHLEVASQRRSALYSHNIPDFCRIHGQWLSSGRSHHGIILAQQQRYSVREQLRGLLKLINSKSAEQMRDSLGFLGSWD